MVIKCVIICHCHLMLISSRILPLEVPPMTFWHVPIILWALPSFPAQRDIPDSYCIFPNLESVISLRNLVSFSGKLYLEIMSCAFSYVLLLLDCHCSQTLSVRVDRAIKYSYVNAHTHNTHMKTCRHTYTFTIMLIFKSSNIYWQSWGCPSPSHGYFSQPTWCFKGCIAQKGR